VIEFIFILFCILVFIVGLLTIVGIIPGRYKVYMAFVLSCLFLCTVFGLFKYFAEMADRI
jgi:hypothetical protein